MSADVIKVILADDHAVVRAGEIPVELPQVMVEKQLRQPSD